MERNDILGLIDDDLLRRAAISHTLSMRGIHVEPYENIGELTAHGLRSGLILAYDGGGNLSGLIESLVRAGHWLPVIAFAENPTPQAIVDAILAGAVAYVTWPFDEGKLGETIAQAKVRGATAGNARLREVRARSRIDCLTRREREVLSGVASGLSSRLIGEQLSISPRTVEVHRANMLHKIGVNHTSEAIKIAIEASLVS